MTPKRAKQMMKDIVKKWVTYGMLYISIIFAGRTIGSLFGVVY